MRRCRRCEGWVPTASTCPNCAALAPAAPAWLRGIATAAGGAALGVSLSACGGSSEPTPTPTLEPYMYNSAAYGSPYISEDANLRLAPCEDDLAAAGEGDPPAGHHHDGAGRGVSGPSPGLEAHDPDAAPCDGGASPAP